ncbi:MAG: MFS transporter [Caldimonas sp.]
MSIASLDAPAAAPYAPGSRPWRGGWRDGLSYGGLGLPLAFVELPLYVLLPNYYASKYGVPLALLGAVLLAARLLDAIADPFIGRWADALFGRSPRQALRWLAYAAIGLAIGFRALFFPPVHGGTALLVWCAAGLALTYLSFSTVMVIHQAWGARLAGDEIQRARIVAWREGLALAGVMVAGGLRSAASLDISTWVFAGLLLAGVALLSRAPRAGKPWVDNPKVSMWLPWRTQAFRRLLSIYLFNGIASAVPATLVLFFIQDRLEAPAYQGLFLGSYFAAAAVAIPVWVRLVPRFGLARTWLAAMLLAIATFGWATQLGRGDVVGFAVVCLTSGVALGADLTLPSAMLTGVIQRAGHGQHAEGSYLGWWSFATKLNLALAAGLALPALQASGYAAGVRDAAALTALTGAYCLLPCALKAVAVAILHFGWIRAPEGRS